MDSKSSVKSIILLIGGMLIVVVTMAALIPFLNHILKVDVVRTGAAVVTSAPVQEKPEALSVSAIYQMEKESKKISAIYIEVFHTGSNQVSYLEVPVDTKVNLSEQLYKSLQTYAPELPQYLKLSNMAEGFSKEYGLTGCNRILSEVLGVSLENYVRADKETLQSWLALQAEEKSATGFFEDYAQWLEQSESGLEITERWMYYESWKQVTGIQVETAPGSREKDGFLLSGKQSRERLQELMSVQKAK